MKGAGTVRLCREDNLGASTFIEKGWCHIAQGSYAAAEAALATAIELAPSDTRARGLLGWAVMRQGRYDEALTILEDVLLADGANSMARANLGYVYLRMGLLPEARIALLAAIESPRDPKAALYANFYLGLLHGSLSEYCQAKEFLERSIAIGPNFIEAYYELGRAYWQAGHEAEADTVWKRGNMANRFGLWGRRCAEAMRVVRAGEEVPDYN